MTVLSRVHTLVQQALDQFDDPGMTTAALLRRCIRIATLRNDFASLVWLEMEARSSGTESTDEIVKRRAELAANFSQQDWKAIWPAAGEQWIRRRQDPDDSNKIHQLSVQELDDFAATMERQAAVYTVPTGLTPIDLYFRSEEYDQRKLELMTKALTIRQVLGRVRERLFQFLVETERQLNFGRVNADIFERNRAYVDARLAKLAPEVLEQFQAAYKRITEGDAEALSHALTSVRRLLKSLADNVYPPRIEPVLCADGQTRDMSEAKYLNRLYQFVSESVGRHGSGQIVRATIAELNARLKAIDEMSSKGVHATVTITEVDNCVIQAYLVVGEIMRIWDDVAPTSTEIEVGPESGEANDIQ
jgi:hypothetical protein